jgi:tetratricopeptide (TPR) repeat protein
VVAQPAPHAFRPAVIVAPVILNVTGAYSIETSSSPCTDGVLSTVRPLAERVKRPACRYTTQPFRARGIAITLESMPASGEAEFVVPTNEDEIARAELVHEPFFRALAALEGHEDGREWRALIAGLVTLRLADQRIASTEHGIRRRPQQVPDSGLTPDVPAEVIESARAAAGAVDDQDSVAGPLRALVQSASATIAADLPERLLAYAHALHADSRLPLAVDVYRMVLRVAAAPQPDGAPATRAFVPYAYDRLGRSLRLIGDLDGAIAAYQAGCGAAYLLGDGYAERLMRISRAKILMHLGNLPAAAAALDAIIRDAASTPHAGRESAGRSKSISARDRAEVLALARHDRGLIATMQHEFNLAAEQYFAAWRGYRDPDRRERVWVDLALNFAEMGQRDVAREAFLVLHATARRREVQFIAAANLLELAVFDGHEGLFEHYRHFLHEAERSGSLTAEVAAKFALYEGRGHARFGRSELARLAFQRALAIATRDRVNEVTIRADEALGALRVGQPVADWSAGAASISIPTSIERITRVVRRARRSAVVAPS